MLLFVVVKRLKTQRQDCADSLNVRRLRLTACFETFWLKRPKAANNQQKWVLAVSVKDVNYHYEKCQFVVDWEKQPYESNVIMNCKYACDARKKKVPEYQYRPCNITENQPTVLQAERHVAIVFFTLYQQTKALTFKSYDSK